MSAKDRKAPVEHS